MNAPLALLALSLSTVQGPPAPPSDLFCCDLDRDGDLDALSIDGAGELRLLRNGGDGVFADETLAAGLAEVRGVRSVATEDRDGDGSPDLALGGERGVRLFRARGLSFVDVTESAGLGGAGPVTALGWVDADGDGRLDLHVAALAGHRVFRNGPEGFFRELELASAEPSAGVLVSPSGAPSPESLEQEPPPGVGAGPKGETAGRLFTVGGSSVELFEYDPDAVDLYYHRKD